MTLNHEQILALPEGRETDALVAEAMGWRRGDFGHGELVWISHPLGDWSIDGELEKHEYLPYFSGNISDAWTLVVEMLKTHTVKLWLTENEPQARVTLQQIANVSVTAHTAPLAICRAFLLAKLKEV